MSSGSDWASNGTTPGLFHYILVCRSKSDLKSPGFVLFGANLTHIRAKSENSVGKSQRSNRDENTQRDKVHGLELIIRNVDTKSKYYHRLPTYRHVISHQNEKLLNILPPSYYFC